MFFKSVVKKEAVHCLLFHLHPYDVDISCRYIMKFTHLDDEDDVNIIININFLNANNKILNI